MPQIKFFAAVLRSYTCLRTFKNELIWNSPDSLTREVWRMTPDGTVTAHADTPPENYAKGLLYAYIDGSPCTILELEAATGRTHESIEADILAASVGQPLPTK